MMTTEHKATVTLPTDDQILITRDFDAPPHLVYKAWTTPELVTRWWAGKRGQVDSIEIDLRVGGSWRYVMTADEGFQVAFHGEYREIVEDERLVYTDVYEGMPDGQAITTVTFAALEDGRTRMTTLVQHTSKEHRDLHVSSGMEGGMNEAMDALEEVAAALPR